MKIYITVLSPQTFHARFSLIDLSLESRESEAPMWYPRAGEDGCVSWSREREVAVLCLFCSFQALNWLVDAHSHRGGSSALLSSSIQTLISSRNTVRDTPRNFYQLCGHTLAQSSWQHEINQHSRLTLKCLQKLLHVFPEPLLLSTMGTTEAARLWQHKGRERGGGYL